MASATNPLIGASGWGNNPQSGSIFTNPINVPQGQNPAAQPNKMSWMNPGNYSNPTDPKKIQSNLGLTNIMAGQMKNYMAPQFANLMGQYGGQAGNYFQNLMNLGSPYYQQKQAEGLQQGVNQNQQAGANAMQQLNASGYGFGPSGARAAMMGGMQQTGAQNLAEQYLQNLFQNEQMQAMGATGLQGLAGTFNPASILSGTSLGTGINQSPTAAQSFGSVMQGLGSIF